MDHRAHDKMIKRKPSARTNESRMMAVNAGEVRVRGNCTEPKPN